MTYKERIQKLISNKFGDTGARLQVATLMEEINLNFYTGIPFETDRISLKKTRGCF